MRLICTLHDQKNAHTLSSYLKKEGIDNEVEIKSNTDWGSSDYGTIDALVWVYDEDRFDTALQIAQEFIQNPTDTRYHVTEKKSESLSKPFQASMKGVPQRLLKVGRTQALAPQPLGILTLYFLIGCSIIFLISTFTTPPFETPPPNLPYTPLFTAPINKQLMYDYPKTYEIVEKLEKIYGIEKLQTPNHLPAEGQYLLRKLYETPYWQGYYPILVDLFRNQSHPREVEAPLFEKIRQGQVWRIFSPCLLHSDIFHLFFNMIWLAILGKQIEERLGSIRYFFFILLTGIITNTCQYLMGGPNFIGFSGILCAMLTFIWIRQKIAAWEGYQLQNATFGFIIFFILAMFMIQVASFFLETYFQTSISPGIANTAHLSGAVVGLALGSLNFFAYKKE